MKRYLCSFLLLFPITLFSQAIISFNQGYGLYAMRDIKKIQSDATSTIPVKMHNNMSFPGYWYYELSSQYVIMDELLVGGSFTYGSTAGRSSYSDYSGSITFDQRLVFYSLSASLGKNMTLDNEKTQITVDAKPTLLMTHTYFDFNQSIGQQSQKDSYQFNSVNLAIQPTISILHPFGKFILRGGVGFHANLLSGKMNLNENDDAYLQDSKGDPVYVNWSGLRISLGVGYQIGKRYVN